MKLEAAAAKQLNTGLGELVQQLKRKMANVTEDRKEIVYPESTVFGYHSRWR